MEPDPRPGAKVPVSNGNGAAELSVTRVAGRRKRRKGWPVGLSEISLGVHIEESFSHETAQPQEEPEDTGHTQPAAPGKGEIQ